MMKNKQTIVAISTPPGMGGVGIVRLSGIDALKIADRVFEKKSKNSWEHGKLQYGFIHDLKNSENLDDGYAAYFQSPHTFTGEDIVEFQLHGNPVLLSGVVELCLREGARLAEAGEFTKRAYLNGKMDLLQAEAVAELIHSQSLIEVKRSRMRLDGKLSSHLETLREEVIDVLAEIEADVDFPEEEINTESQNAIFGRIEKLKHTTENLLNTYQQNQKVTSGFRVALVGKPNVGKSSLFNTILDHDRAIVTPHAGTTRDVLSEEILLEGYRVKLLDTAGLRKEFANEIEKEGIVRSGNEISKADLVLWIISTSDEEKDHGHDLRQIPREKLWVVWNKIDVQKPTWKIESTKSEKEFFVSAKNRTGVDELIRSLRAKVQESNTSDFGGGISNDRQKELLQLVLEHASKTMSMMRDREAPEVVSAEFRHVFHALNRMLGKEENLDAVYDRIFSKFCIGK